MRERRSKLVKPVKNIESPTIGESPPIVESPTYGYIYCISNPSYQNGLFKIGHTNSTPNERMKNLYSSGVPLPFKLELSKKVIYCQEKEKLLHKMLDKYRINSNREFFQLPLETIRVLFDVIEGEWC